MREIKFRSWDGKRFHYWGFSYEDDQPWFSGPDNHIHAIQEQFTGLTDSEGKEIYEGDIIRADDLIARVIYSQRWTEFRLVGANSVGWYQDIKVIGTIHTHPELLESNQ